MRSWLIFICWIGGDEYVRNQDFAQKFPGIKIEGLRQVYVYYNGKTNDLKITCRIAQDAIDSGCMVRENCQMVVVDVGDKLFAVYKDGNGEHKIEAPLLINATGLWIDEVNAKYRLPHNYCIKKVNGIHIVINRVLVPDCRRRISNGLSGFY